MLLLGLTGSIATGKSTVSRLLSSPPYSLPLIDADLLARQVVEPGTRAYTQILSHFGPTTPDLLLPAAPSHQNNNNSKGRPLDRAALGRRVFGNSAERRRDRAVLNSIVHPAVRRAMALAVLQCYVRGHWAVVLDIPLLFESGLDVFCGVVLVVGVHDPAVQMRRLRERDPGLTEAEARDRVLSQGTVKEKVERVKARGLGKRGAVVWNDGGKGELEGEVRRVMGEVERGRRGWWAWWLWGSPVVAVAVGGWEVWRGWRARRGFEERMKGEKAML